MGFFHRIGSALSRWMYGRNGIDQLGLACLWTGIVLNVWQMFSRNEMLKRLLGALSLVLLAILVFRMLSRNLQKRRAENARFLNKVLYPVKRKFGTAKQRVQDKEHKYFTCPDCKTVCRVPKGKGKIVITCPRCRREIKGKS